MSVRALNDDALDLLNDALQASSGQPPTLDVDVFIRANPERIADLDWLIADQRLLVGSANKLRLMFSALALLRARPSATHKSIWREQTNPKPRIQHSDCANHGAYCSKIDQLGHPEDVQIE